MIPPFTHINLWFFHRIFCYILNLQRTIRPPSSPVLQSKTVKSDVPACSQEATLHLQQSAMQPVQKDIVYFYYCLWKMNFLRRCS